MNITRTTAVALSALVLAGCGSQAASHAAATNNPSASPTAPASIPPSSEDDGGFVQPGPATTPAPATTSAAGGGSSPVLDAKFGQTYALDYVSDYDHNNNAEYAEYTMTVAAPTVTSSALSQYGSPPSHGHYLVFRVTFAAKSEGVTYNVMDFDVRDKANEKSSCGTGEDTLGDGTLHAGQKASGTIICDVAVTDGTLVFDPSRPDYTGSLIEWPF